MSNLAHGFYFPPHMLPGGKDPIKEEEEANLLALQQFLGLEANSFPPVGGDVNYGNEGRREPMEQLLASTGLAPTKSSVPAKEQGYKGTMNPGAVNKNTAYHGGRAIIGPDGKVTLTNQNPDGTWNPGGELATKRMFSDPSVPVAIAPSAPAVIQKTLKQMSEMDDPIAMRALAESAKSALFAEETKLQAEAIKFAETKYGVRELERRLNESIATDAQFPAERAMYGDSPVTKQLRATLDGIRSLVDGESKKFLSTNPNMAILNSAKASIEYETKRMGQLDAVRMQRRAMRDEANEDFVASLSPEQIRRVQILEGSTGQLSADQIAAKFKMLKGANAQAELQAIQAPKEYLPRLALAGNPFAKKIFITEESIATKESPDRIEAKLNEARRIFTTPAEFNVAYATITKKPLDNSSGGSYTKLETRAGLSKEERAAVDTEKYQIVMDYMRYEATNRVLKDVGSLNSNDPALNAAIAQARQVTNNASIPNVLTAWLTLNKADSMEKKLHFAKMLSDRLQEESAKYAGSSFGTPIPETIKSAIVHSIRNENSWLGAIREWQRGNEVKGAERKATMLRQQFQFIKNPLTGNEEVTGNGLYNGKTFEEMMKTY